MHTTLLEDTTPTSRAELEQALTNHSHRAQREYPVVGPTSQPTPWDRRHQQINDLLDHWQHTSHVEAG